MPLGHYVLRSRRISDSTRRRRKLCEAQPRPEATVGMDGPHERMSEANERVKVHTDRRSLQATATVRTRISNKISWFYFKFGDWVDEWRKGLKAEPEIDEERVYFRPLGPDWTSSKVPSVRQLAAEPEYLWALGAEGAEGPINTVGWVIKLGGIIKIEGKLWNNLTFILILWNIWINISVKLKYYEINYN